MTNRRQKRPPRACLYCPKPADSPEHFLAAAIGGRLRPLLLCGDHQRLTNERCDKAFVAQLEYFVHALRVVKDHGRGDPGRVIKGTDENGVPYIVDADHKPRLAMNVTAFSLDRKPMQTRFRTTAEAERFFEKMGLSLDDPRITIEERTEVPPSLNFQPELGGPDGLRGVLKIAYEFVLGQQEGIVLEKVADERIRSTILDYGDPLEFVRWLPFTMLPTNDQAPYYSHRLIAWQDGPEALVVVELFNLLPFVVRLPGVQVTSPALLNQGLHGQAPEIAFPSATPSWRWNDVPEHAQPLNVAEFEERLKKMMTAVQLGDFTQIVGEAVVTALKRANRDTPVDTIVEDAVTEAIPNFARPDIDEGFIEEIRTMAKAMVDFVRAHSPPA